LVTFAFLVEAFAQLPTGNVFRKKDNKPNVSAIAKHLEKLATDSTTGEVLDGQSDETIKSCIEEAMKEKQSRLPAANRTT